LPFDGETVGEILMKHLTSQPDLSLVPKEYAGVIGKSLVKNPVERFQTFNEFAEAVAKVAGKTAPRSIPKAMPASIASFAASPVAQTTPYPTPQKNGSSLSSGSYGIISRDKVGELCWSMVQATLFSILGILIWAAIMGPAKGEFHFREYLGLLNTLILTSWAVLITGKFWDGRAADPWPRRTILLACGLGIGAFSGFMNPMNINVRTATSLQLDQSTIWVMLHHAFFFGVGLFSMKWWNLTARYRSSRFNFWSFVLTGIIGGLIFWIMMLGNEKAVMQSLNAKNEFPAVLIVLMMANGVVQLSSPWSAAPPKSSRKLRWKTA